MNCPKCGAAQDDGRQECVSCGIVFARWRATQERRMPTGQRWVPAEEPLMTPQFPAAAAHVSRPVPVWLIVAVAVVLVVFGLVWTSRRREARAKAQAEFGSQLDQINQSGLKDRQRAKVERDAERRKQAAQINQAVVREHEPKYPADFDEATARRALEDCAFFRTEVRLEIPKEFDSSGYLRLIETHPALATAIHERFVETVPTFDTGRARYNDPPRVISVNLTLDGLKALHPMQTPTAYVVSLGYRKLLAVHLRQASDDYMALSFDWAYDEEPVAKLLATDDAPFDGMAEFVREKGNPWKMVRATVRHKNSSVLIASNP